MKVDETIPREWVCALVLMLGMALGVVVSCSGDGSGGDTNDNTTNNNANGQCVDDDGDGYGVGAACLGPDCDDADPQCWQGNCCLPPGCIDLDGDGYGEGADCLGSDCNEEDAQCWQAGDGCCAPTACVDEWHNGDGTYYTFADGSGNCSFPPTPEDLMVAAINDVDYAGSAPCGSCVFIQGPTGNVTVRIVDRCPECPEGDLDLSPEAFERISPLQAGRVDITWQYVPCNVNGPIRYRFKEGSNQWWTAVQVRNHRHAIARFEYLASGGSWQEVARTEYNYFVEESGMGPGPYSFRVTDIYGNVLNDTGIPHLEAQEVAGASQFPPCE